MLVEIIVNPRRNVALGDVLGFKNLVDSTDLRILVGKYKTMLERAHKMCGTNIQPTNDADPPEVFNFTIEIGNAVFSDTIVLWSDCDNGDEAFEFEGQNFFMTCAVVFCVALANRFPLRLGIAYGDCVIEPEESLYVGKAIIDAYYAERCQDWVGAACHPSCLTAPYSQDLLNTTGIPFSAPLIQYDIPVKHDVTDPGVGWTIDWPYWSLPVGLTPQLLNREAEKYRGTEYANRWTRTVSYYNERMAKWETLKGGVR